MRISRPGPAAFLVLVAVLVAATFAPGAAAVTLKWQRSYDGPAHGIDAFESVAVTTGGDAVAAGYASVSGAHGTDLIVRRYSAAGGVVWTRLWNGPGAGNDRAKAIVADGAGGFFVAGTTAGRGGDVVLLRYRADGALRWARRYDSGAARHDEGLFAVTDAAHDAYVVGTTKTGAGIVWRVLKYDVAGRLLWSRTLKASKGNAVPTDADGDGAGRLFVTGWAEYAGGKAKAVTRAYSAAGGVRWTRTLVLDQITRATGVSWSPEGVYVSVSGLFFGEIIDTARLVSYAPASGAEQWSAAWTGVPGGMPYEFRDVVALPLVGSVTAGDYALAPGMGPALLFRDVIGAGLDAHVWSDPGRGWAGLMVVRDAGGGAWMVGFHESAISVVRYVPIGAVSAPLEVSPFPFNGPDGAAAYGGSVLYVVGTGQSGSNLQAQILKIGT